MVLRKSDTIESSAVTRDVWIMILCRRDRIRLIDGVNADRCRFVRVLWEVIFNETILIVKENKRIFYPFQHISIQHNSNYSNFLINLTITRSFMARLSVKAHTNLRISCS